MLFTFSSHGQLHLEGHVLVGTAAAGGDLGFGVVPLLMAHQLVGQAQVLVQRHEEHPLVWQRSNY